MRYYIIAGEASGDLHAANLVEALKHFDPHPVVRGCGGDLMKAKGADIVLHYKDLAYMGYKEVISHIAELEHKLNFCKRDLEAFGPDAVILVDYPGFNLKIAKFAKKRGFKVYYYIAPQVWAWKEKRVSQLEKYVDKLFCILPFEKDYFKKYNVDAEYVGHPLVEQVKALQPVDEARFRKENHLKPNREIIALLPGSRRQELDRMMEVMVNVAPLLKDYQFVVAMAPNVSSRPYRRLMSQFGVRFVKNQTYPLLQLASAAVVTSGTATLEAALLNVPEVVCYKTSKMTYRIAKKLVKVDFISLPNLILGREVVRELIQDDCTPKNVSIELKHVLHDSLRQRKMLEDYEDLSSVLSDDKPSLKIAETICNGIRKKK